MAVSREALENFDALSSNPYPGRGIILGVLASGNAAQVYWVMGRSEPSRNRILKEENGIVKTDVLDEAAVTPEQLELIRYNAMDSTGSRHVVSNGAQTDAIVQGLRYGMGTFKELLGKWDYEPDAPNFTPRISGLIDTASQNPSYKLSVITKAPDSEDAHRAYHEGGLGLMNSQGLGVHTYLGDGNPLPSFDKAPIDLPLAKDREATAGMYWEALNEANRVALVVKEIDRSTGQISHTIINAREA